MFCELTTIMKFTSEISLKIRTAITVKLAELGNDVYEELPDYIMVMVANKKSKDQMSQDLALFLGDITDQFTTWLHSLVSKLQSVASESAGTKGGRMKTGKNTTSVTPRDSDTEQPTHDFNEGVSYATVDGSDEASTSCMNSTDVAGKHESDDLKSTHDAEKCESVDSKHTTADADSTSKLTNFTFSSNLSVSVDDPDNVNGNNDDDVNTEKGVLKRKTDSESKSIKGKIRKVDPYHSHCDNRGITKASLFQKEKSRREERTSDSEKKALICNKLKSPCTGKESLPNGPASEVSSSGKPTEVSECEVWASNKNTDLSPSASETTDEKKSKPIRIKWH